MTGDGPGVLGRQAGRGGWQALPPIVIWSEAAAPPALGTQLCH